MYEKHGIKISRSRAYGTYIFGDLVVYGVSKNKKLCSSKHPDPNCVRTGVRRNRQPTCNYFTRHGESPVQEAFSEFK